VFFVGFLCNKVHVCALASLFSSVLEGEPEPHESSSEDKPGRVELKALEQNEAAYG
jgi:hypothetical protein